jgi:hypothetical protein
MTNCLFGLILLLSSTVYAITGDLDADGHVYLSDLVIFADSWLTDDGGDLDNDNDTDFADFAILAQHWLEGCDTVATVDAVNMAVGCQLAESVSFRLTATSTETLTYRVTSLPARGTLYDGITMTAITSVPFTLYSDYVQYNAHATIAGVVSFTWSATTAADDCGQSNSDTATATITVCRVPTATAQSASGTAYIWKTITLAAVDDGLPTPPGRLKYIISTLPAVGLLYDPKSGAGQITKVPYSLSSWGTDVLYITAATGNSSFGFKASDGGVSPFGGISSEATVSITTAANPLDCLSYDGLGSVSIPDGTYLDAGNGWAIDFWVKTRQPYAMLVDKRTTGAGYEIKLVAGRPMIEIYDATGLIATMYGAYFARIDNDQWHEVEFCTYAVTGGWELFIQVVLSDLVYVDANTGSYTGTMPTLSNAEAVVVGSGFKGSFDKLRYFSAITDPTSFGALVQFASRTELTTLWEMTPNVQFNCNEGTGTTITDSKTSKVGTFSSADHVAWHPWIVPFVDVSVPRYYGGGQ